MNEHFPNGEYQDVVGLCKVASRSEIEDEGWSLNPSRYVGLQSDESTDDVEFRAKAERLREEFETLTSQAHEYEEEITMNLDQILES
jgi:type I restriction enzyme M protein